MTHNAAVKYAGTVGRRKHPTSVVTVHLILVAFFIVPGLTWAKLGMYLAVLFCQPGEKFGLFFYPVGKKRMARYMPGLVRVKPGTIKNMTNMF